MKTKLRRISVETELVPMTHGVKDHDRTRIAEDNEEALH